MPTSRRAFLEEVSFASLIAGFPLSAQAALQKYAETPPEPLFPKALKRGDTIALIAPASPGSEPDDNEVAVEIVTGLGYKPKLMPNSGKSTRYLAGTDIERAIDLNAAFADSSVDAVWCLRGGYGTPRILPFLDYETIRKNPKIFVGYTDITGTLNAIHRLTGLVTFHGPMVGDNQSDYTLEQFWRVVANPRAAGRIAEPPSPILPPREGWVDRENRLYRLAPGKAKGRLVGGNISVFSTLIGTPFEPELKGRILFLEEVDEEPYRIDRWLTQFLLTGKLSGLAGVALGKFHDCGPRTYKPGRDGIGHVDMAGGLRGPLRQARHPGRRRTLLRTRQATRRRCRSASWPSWTPTRARSRCWSPRSGEAEARDWRRPPSRGTDGRRGLARRPFVRDARDPRLAREVARAARCELARAFDAPAKHGMPAIQLGPSEAKAVALLLKLAGAQEGRRGRDARGLLGASSWRGRCPRTGTSGRSSSTRSTRASPARTSRRRGSPGSVTVLEGAGLDVLPSLEPARPLRRRLRRRRQAQLRRVRPLGCAKCTRPGGLLIGDNAFLFGRLLEDSSEAIAMRRFHEEAREAFDTVCLPTPDGLLLGLKR